MHLVPLPMAAAPLAGVDLIPLDRAHTNTLLVPTSHSNFRHFSSLSDTTHCAMSYNHPESDPVADDTHIGNVPAQDSPSAINVVKGGDNDYGFVETTSDEDEKQSQKKNVNKAIFPPLFSFSGPLFNSQLERAVFLEFLASLATHSHTTRTYLFLFFFTTTDKFFISFVYTFFVVVVLCCFIFYSTIKIFTFTSGSNSIFSDSYITFDLAFFCCLHELCLQSSGQNGYTLLTAHTLPWHKSRHWLCKKKNNSFFEAHNAPCASSHGGGSSGRGVDLIPLDRAHTNTLLVPTSHSNFRHFSSLSDTTHCAMSYNHPESDPVADVPQDRHAGGDGYLPDDQDTHIGNVPAQDSPSAINVVKGGDNDYGFVETTSDEDEKQSQKKNVNKAIFPPLFSFSGPLFNSQLERAVFLEFLASLATHSHTTRTYLFLFFFTTTDKFFISFVYTFFVVVVFCCFIFYSTIKIFTFTSGSNSIFSDSYITFDLAFFCCLHELCLQSSGQNGRGTGCVVGEEWCKIELFVRSTGVCLREKPLTLSSMGCSNSHTKHDADGGKKNSANEGIVVAIHGLKDYQKEKAADWEVLLEGPAGTSSKKNRRSKSSKFIRGTTSTLLQVVPLDDEGAIVGRGFHGEVRLARVVIRLDEHDALEPTRPLCVTALTASKSVSGSKEDSVVPDLPVQEQYLSVVKEWQLPPSAASKGNLMNNKILQHCSMLVKKWRRLSAECEGIMQCIGAEIRDPIHAGQGGGGSGNPSQRNSFAVKGPRFRVYLECCRFGTLHQLREKSWELFGTHRLHELTARALMREVLLSLFQIHKRGYLQYDITARSIFLQHPIEALYGSWFPTQLGEGLALSLAQHLSPSAATQNLDGSRYAVGNWCVNPSCKELLQSFRSWSVAVDVPVSCIFATEPPPRDEVRGSTNEADEPDDTPIPPTIATHPLNDSPHGGLSLLIPHKFSGPIVGYVTGNGDASKKKSSPEIMKLNQYVLMEVLKSEGKQQNGSVTIFPGLSPSAPPPMLIERNAPHLIAPTTSFSSAVRPRFATRLLHSAEIRRALLEPIGDAAAGGSLNEAEVPGHKFLSVGHLAPEVLLNGEFSEESDIYSWAMTFIELVTDGASITSTSSRSARVELLPECLPPGPPPRTRAERLAYDQEWAQSLKAFYLTQLTREKQLVEQQRHNGSNSFSNMELHSASNRSTASAALSAGCISIPVRRGPKQHLTLYPIVVNIPSHLSSECQMMLQWCLQLDPNRRPSVSELLYSRYFRLWEWITCRSASTQYSSRRVEECLPEQPKGGSTFSNFLFVLDDNRNKRNRRHICSGIPLDILSSGAVQRSAQQYLPTPTIYLYATAAHHFLLLLFFLSFPLNTPAQLPFFRFERQRIGKVVGSAKHLPTKLVLLEYVMSYMRKDFLRSTFGFHPVNERQVKPFIKLYVIIKTKRRVLHAFRFSPFYLKLFNFRHPKIRRSISYLHSNDWLEHEEGIFSRLMSEQGEASDTDVSITPVAGYHAYTNKWAQWRSNGCQTAEPVSPFSCSTTVNSPSSQKDTSIFRRWLLWWPQQGQKQGKRVGGSISSSGLSARKRHQAKKQLAARREGVGPSSKPQSNAQRKTEMTHVSFACDCNSLTAGRHSSSQQPGLGSSVEEDFFYGGGSTWDRRLPNLRRHALRRAAESLLPHPRATVSSFSGVSSPASAWAVDAFPMGLHTRTSSCDTSSVGSLSTAASFRFPLDTQKRRAMDTLRQAETSKPPTVGENHHITPATSLTIGTFTTADPCQELQPPPAVGQQGYEELKILHEKMHAAIDVWAQRPTAVRELPDAESSSSIAAAPMDAVETSREVSSSEVDLDGQEVRLESSSVLLQELEETLAAHREKWGHPSATLARCSSGDDSASSDNGRIPTRSSSAGVTSLVVGDTDRRERMGLVRNVFRAAVHHACTKAATEVVKRKFGQLHAVQRRFISEWCRRAVVKRALRHSEVQCAGILRHIRSGTPVSFNALAMDDEDSAWVKRVQLRGNANVSPPELDLGGLTLTYGQLATLTTPRTWLNDQAINAYLDLLCRCRCPAESDVSAARVASMGTHFFAKVQQELGAERNVFPPLRQTSGVLRWLRRRTQVLLPPTSLSMGPNGVEASPACMVLIPVNLDNQHWVLAVWDKLNETFTLYDSLLHSSKEHLHNLRMLRHAFAESYRLLGCDQHTNKKLNERSSATWEIEAHSLHVAHPWSPPVPKNRSMWERAKSLLEKRGAEEEEEEEEDPHLVPRAGRHTPGNMKAPQQLNGSDCGAYVCLMAWCCSQGVAVEFPLEAQMIRLLRVVMGMELWCNQLLHRLPCVPVEGKDGTNGRSASSGVRKLGKQAHRIYKQFFPFITTGFLLSKVMAAPAATQRCEPQPLIPASRSYWVSDLDARLFTQWNEANTRVNEPEAPPESPLSMSTSYRSNLSQLYAKNNVNSNITSSNSRGVPAAKVPRTENGFDDPLSGSGGETSNPQDYCQKDPFPLCRSTGVPYSAQPIVRQHAQAPGEKKPLTVPFGMRYHVRLQQEWNVDSHQDGPRSPASSSSDTQLDDSLVLDIINSPDSASFPQPIPLSQMLELLHPMWEEEGLIDLARSREAQAQKRP
eukprot:gene3960-2823_t